MVSAQASYAWTACLGLHPKRFKELGDVDPQVSQALSAPIERLADGFLAIAQFVDRHTDPEQSREQSNRG